MCKHGIIVVDGRITEVYKSIQHVAGTVPARKGIRVSFSCEPGSGPTRAVVFLRNVETGVIVEKWFRLMDFKRGKKSLLITRNDWKGDMEYYVCLHGEVYPHGLPMLNIINRDWYFNGAISIEIRASPQRALDTIKTIKDLHNFVNAFIYKVQEEYDLDVPKGLVYDKAKPVLENMVQTKKLYMYHDRPNAPPTVVFSKEFVHAVLQQT
jgi:hypothetical protein